MQPTVICTARVPGMIYLNGRFAGEASAERPLFAPVSPGGPLYLEYRPLSAPDGQLSRRIVFSGGAPLADSLADAEGLCCVAWPGGALEVEIVVPRPVEEVFALEGLPCLLVRSQESVLTLNGLDIALPEGAGRPSLLRVPGAAALLGDIEGGGQYLAALTPDLSSQMGLLTARRVDYADDGVFSVAVALGDSVGHGRLERWLLDGNGLNRVSSEPAWSQGAPIWPATAEGTLIAAVEAALAGLTDEAEGYMSPALAATGPLDSIAKACDACVPLKYGLPDARPRAGLLRLENAHLATVRPLYCRAEETGGAQGPYTITSLETE